VQIDNGKRVRLKVKLSEVKGALIEDGEVEYVHGAGSMLAGLEAALAGVEQGASRTGVIPAIEAFGDPRKQPKKTMKRTDFPADVTLEVGAELSAKAENGQPVLLAIEEVRGDEVVVRLVHPLARKDIAFDVKVLAVTDRSPPPLPADAVVDDD
jgi:peptidylprolyl isomerase